MYTKKAWYNASSDEYVSQSEMSKHVAAGENRIGRTFSQTSPTTVDTHYLGTPRGYELRGVPDHLAQALEQHGSYMPRRP